MDKLKMETPNITQINIEKIAELFPNVVKEAADGKGKVTRKIDFDALRQELSTVVIDDDDERYDFTWVGKKQAVVEANTPIRKTLRPCIEESKDWENTGNLYIEGDNLDALKLLQESYLGQIKMIYIDPPYNTGHDFIYRDSFKQSEDEFNEEIGMYDEEGNRLFQNTDSNGRFHSDWCSMIYARLKLARNLLTDDGVIFISIDDNEVGNLRKICDEVFGESNFIAQINWKGRGGRQDSKYYAVIHEFILCYARSINNFVAGEEIKSGDVYPKYDKEKNRYYKTQLLRKWGSNSRKEDRPNLFYPIQAPDGTEVYPMLAVLTAAQRPSFPNSGKEGCWRWSASTMSQAINEGRVEFVKQDDNSWIPYEKIYAPLPGEEKTKKYVTWIDDISNGTDEIKSIFDFAAFDYAKSSTLINKFLKMAKVGNNDIILDFFSGSATTAHALMQLNAEDGGNRKFIMVQLPEECDEKSEAYKAGYKNICEIGKERIRRAGEKIKAEIEKENQQISIDAEPKKVPDIGFRVLKIDSTNMKDVYYGAGEITQMSLDDMVSNIKEDRTDLDLLYGVLTDWGLPLGEKHEIMDIDGVRVHNYDDLSLIACFEENVPESVIRKIAALEPLRAVFRDSSFADSPSRINVEEIFKLKAPTTKVKVI